MLAVPGPQAKSQTSQAKGGVTVFRLVGDIALWPGDQMAREFVVVCRSVTPTFKSCSGR